MPAGTCHHVVGLPSSTGNKVATAWQHHFTKQNASHRGAGGFQIQA